MSTFRSCTASLSLDATLDATPALDVRSFHASIMAAATPMDFRARALREISHETDRLLRLFARDELAIFWPSWR